MLKMEQTSVEEPLKSIDTSSGSAVVTTAIVWTLIVSLPLALTVNANYETVFPTSWYEYDHSSEEQPKPLGLSLGIFAVVVGQICVLMYHWVHRAGLVRGSHTAIQQVGAPEYDFKEGLLSHLAQPEGFVMLGAYLSGTWMFRLMPASYYSFEGGINWYHVAVQLLLQDFIQYIMHRLEHAVSPSFYKASHKPHHRFTNPRLFDAFNGSMADTTLMILVPLYITALTVHCNVWSYMAFGSLYANWLTLIHSEYAHPWDGMFRKLGFGTAADHHVHHKLFKFNYGHLFMYWDMAGGTFRSPLECKPFNKDI